MIRIERNAAPWRAVADHPDVAPHIGPCDIEAWIESPVVIPCWAMNGGWILARIGGAGITYELHAMFSPQGRGRESNLSMKATLAHAFEIGARLITVTEVDDLPMSVPPRSAGFRPAGPFSGRYRLWVLTHDAWLNSPACRRMERSCPNS